LPLHFGQKGWSKNGIKTNNIVRIEEEEEEEEEERVEEIIQAAQG
jgi:hypothetical protein